MEWDRGRGRGRGREGSERLNGRLYIMYHLSLTLKNPKNLYIVFFFFFFFLPPL